MRQAPGEQAGDDDDDDDDNDDGGQANQSEPPRTLGIKIGMRQRVVTAENKSGEESVTIEVYIRWIWGLDSALFESFYGMLRKNLSSVTTYDT